MKHSLSYIFSLLFLFGTTSLHCETNPVISVQDISPESTQDDLKRLDMLIEATQLSLEKQKDIRSLLVEYKDVERACIKNPSDSQKLLELVQIAKTLNTKIQGSSLSDYFRPQLIEELKKLSKVAEKKSIPPAK